MNIEYPEVRRGIPREKEIQEVLELFLAASQLDTDAITIKVVGGDWKSAFGIIGVKLSSLDSKNLFAVPVFIGCNSDTVKAYVYYRTGETSMPAETLYRHMETCCENKIFNVHLYRARELKNHAFGITTAIKQSSATNPLESPVSPEEASSEGLGSPSSPEGEDERQTGDEGDYQENRSSDDREAQNTDSCGRISYAGFFNDGKNLHLAVTALVASFQEGVPFSFHQFAEVLRSEVGILSGNDKEMMQMVGVFSRREFIERLNPGQPPARYVVTEKAVEFAKLPPPPHKLTVIRKPSQKKEQITGDLESQLQVIKEQEDTYQAILLAISKMQQKLVELNPGGLADEERHLRGETANLEKRIATIKERLSVISGIKLRAIEVEQEINGLKSKAGSPEMTAAHEKYVKFKRYFA